MNATHAKPVRLAWRDAEGTPEVPPGALHQIVSRDPPLGVAILRGLRADVSERPCGRFPTRGSRPTTGMPGRSLFFAVVSPPSFGGSAALVGGGLWAVVGLGAGMALEAFAGGGGGRREGASLVFLAQGIAPSSDSLDSKAKRFFSAGGGGVGLEWGFWSGGGCPRLLLVAYPTASHGPPQLFTPRITHLRHAGSAGRK